MVKQIISGAAISNEVPHFLGWQIVTTLTKLAIILEVEEEDSIDNPDYADKKYVPYYYS